MCRVSKKIKFCTCAESSVDRLKHYWIFHKYNKDQQFDILGSMVEPYHIDPQTAIYNEETLLQRINEPDAFDIELHPKDMDRLEITISCSGNSLEQLNYGFSYENGRWNTKDYDPFEWQWSHRQQEIGKIKNPLERKQNT